MTQKKAVSTITGYIYDTSKSLTENLMLTPLPKK